MWWKLGLLLFCHLSSSRIIMTNLQQFFFLWRTCHRCWLKFFFHLFNFRGVIGILKLRRKSRLIFLFCYSSVTCNHLFPLTNLEILIGIFFFEFLWYSWDERPCNNFSLLSNLELIKIFLHKSRDIVMILLLILQSPPTWRRLDRLLNLIENRNKSCISTVNKHNVVEEDLRYISNIK